MHMCPLVGVIDWAALTIAKTMQSALTMSVVFQWVGFVDGSRPRDQAGTIRFRAENELDADLERLGHGASLGRHRCRLIRRRVSFGLDAPVAALFWV